MSNELTIIKQFPQTPSEKRLFVDEITEQILSGNYNPLDIELQLKNLEDVISAIRKNESVKKAVMNEATKYGQKFEFKNAEITVTGRTTYDYSNDAEWNDLKEKIKAREDKLKVARDHKVIDEETGEILMPPISKFSEYLTIKFK